VEASIRIIPLPVSQEWSSGHKRRRWRSAK